MTQTYDAIGQRLSLNDPTGITTYTYDPDSRLSTQTSPSGMRLIYVYDGVGQRKSLTEPEGGRFSYTYDPAGRISKLVNPQNQITSFTYDPASRRTATILANGTRASYTYDDANNQLSVANIGPGSTTLSSFNYMYDPIGNRKRVIEASGNRVTWTYDKTYQLTNEQRSGSNSYNITYTYDPVGNRLAKIAGGVPTTNTYDVANELITSQSSNGTTTNTWDANGNLLISSAPSNQLTTYTWDFENRMTRAALPSGIVDTFEYDGDGSRIKKSDTSGVTIFLWDNQNIMLEYNTSNVIQVVYSLEPEFFGKLISQIRGGITSFYIYDGQDSAVQITNSSSSVTDQYIYDSFGCILLANLSTINFFRFEGKLGYHLDVDLDQLFLRRRYYNPSSGVFTTKDPFLEGKYSNKLFLYCGNNPCNNSDPSGFSEDLWVWPRECCYSSVCGAGLSTVAFEIPPWNYGKVGTVVQHVQSFCWIRQCRDRFSVDHFNKYDYWEAWGVRSGMIEPQLIGGVNDTFVNCPVNQNNVCGGCRITGTVAFLVNYFPELDKTTKWQTQKVGDCVFCDTRPQCKRLKPAGILPFTYGFSSWTSLLKLTKPVIHTMKLEFNCCECMRGTNLCPKKTSISCIPNPEVTKSCSENTFKVNMEQ